MHSARPIFADIFADGWDKMPPALHAHYANRPFSNDRITVEGRLTITMGPLLRFFSPLLKLTGMLTPWEGVDVPCTVTFHSAPDSRVFIFERRFAFPDRAPYIFRSELVPKGRHAVTEYMGSGVGWHSAYSFADERVTISHLGYVWRLFGIDIPFSGLGEWLMGKGEAWEEASGENSFRMGMTLSGGLFGQAGTYGYTGEFTVTEIDLAE